MNETLQNAVSKLNLGNMPDVYTLITNLGNTLGPIKTLIGALAYCIGLWVILAAILKLKNAADDRGRDDNVIMKVGVQIAVGVCLIYLNSTLGALTVTVFGDGNFNPFGYSAGTGLEAKVTAARKVLFMFIGVVGVAAVVRGLLVFRGVSEGSSNETVSKGFIFVFFGAAAIHLDYVIDVLKASAAG
ncbi:hypothetical protein ACKF11_13725 [Methylobacillus sp. Pita2]|uniref:hypothetical protein n=1 Tax=Methylobacillus sp. Pita2 TaxID=3383245 RepID=UPI0038B5BF5A